MAHLLQRTVSILPSQLDRPTRIPPHAGADAECAQVIEALWAKDFSGKSRWGADYESALLDFLVSNLLLGQAKPFPLPPGIFLKAAFGATETMYQRNPDGTLMHAELEIGNWLIILGQANSK